MDGESQLPVLGDVHTVFERGGIKLKFSGLVFANLVVDILAGTNFHIENDVFSHMAKNTISIGDHCVFQSSPPSLLSLDSMAAQSHSSKLVRIQKTLTLAW